MLTDGALSFYRDTLAQTYPDTCTIQVNTPTKSAINEDIEHWSNLAGHVDIACQVALIEVLRDVEREAVVGPVETVRRAVLLDGRYPAITTTHRAVIDGLAWNIVAVDEDSQQSHTRLQIQRKLV
mgnify:CR=1 FL=1